MVKSIANALRLFEYLSLKNEEARITDICKNLDINITAVHRILKTMEKWGFIEQNQENKKYRLGLRAQMLGISAMNQANLYKYGLPCLNEICNLTNETANLVIRDQWECVYILQVESQNALRVANPVGSRAPLYCTAAGKVLLAYMDDALKQRYYEETDFFSLTSNTLDSIEDLEKEIKFIRQNDIAYDREEQALGEACIATPVFNHSGNIIAAISITSPATRLTNRRMKEFHLPLLKKGQELSQRLGFHFENRHFIDCRDRLF